MLPIPIPSFAKALTLIEVYSYFDRPVLFSCQDESGTLFLVVWADDDEESNRETWLFTPIHQGVLEAVRAGGLDLRTGFTSGVGNRAYVVAVDWDARTSSFREVASDQLPAELLPDRGARVSVDTSLEAISSARVAVGTHRIVSNLKLVFDNPLQHAAPATLVGSILHAFQAALDAIVHVTTREDAKNKGPIPLDVRRQAQMQLAGTFAGSFGMRLLSTQSDDYHLEVLKDAFSILSDVIDSGVREEALRVSLQRVSPRFASRYKHLLGFLQGHSTGIALRWDSPDGSAGNASISAQEASEAVSVVNRIVETFQSFMTVEGRLSGLDVDKRTFNLYVDSKTRYVGKLDSEFPLDPHYRIKDRFKAKLREIVTVTSSGTEKTRYQLASLERISESQ